MNDCLNNHLIQISKAEAKAIIDCIDVAFSEGLCADDSLKLYTKIVTYFPDLELQWISDCINNKTA